MAIKRAVRVAKKKAKSSNRREVINFIVTGETDFSGFSCAKCGKVINWSGRHGICCGIKYGVKVK